MHVWVGFVCLWDISFHFSCLKKDFAFWIEVTGFVATLQVRVVKGYCSSRYEMMSINNKIGPRKRIKRAEVQETTGKHVKRLMVTANSTSAAEMGQVKKKVGDNHCGCTGFCYFFFFLRFIFFLIQVFYLSICRSIFDEIGISPFIFSSS